MDADNGIGACRLIELRAQNFLRLQAAAIRPDGQVVEICGANTQGKTSVLRAFWAAIEGRAALGGGVAIKRGKSEGEVLVDLDAIKIERKITRDDDGQENWSIRLTTKDGRRVTNKPQAMLDAIAGDGLNLDPLAFAKWDGKRQADALKRLVPGFDFEENAQRRAAAFADRTDVNRDAKRERAAADSVRLPDGPEPDVVDVTTAVAALNEGNAHNASVDDRARRRREAQDSIDAKRDEAEQLRARAATLDADADALEAKIMAAPPLPAKVDVEALAATIAGAEGAREVKALHEARRRHEGEADRLERRAMELTEVIARLDRQKTEAIAAAKLPVPGLALADDVVTLNGLPLAQNASMAERIKIGMAVAMATAKIPVIMIDEGSELDAASIAEIGAMVAGTPFTVLMCRVDETGERGWIVEDGNVRRAPAKGGGKK